MSATEIIEQVIEKSDNTGTSKYAQVNINKARWDQSTFYGRLRHFAAVTDPRKCLVSNAKLDEAKEIVSLCR